MYSFYTKVQNFEPFLFYGENDQQECVASLLAVVISEGKGLKGYLSSRVVVYGGPIIDVDCTNALEMLDLLLKSLVNKLRTKSIFIQFRNFFEWNSVEKQIFKNNGFDFKERINLVIDTSDRATVLSRISTTKRRQIKKALNSGATISTPKSETDVKQLYSLLFHLYKNKVKKPLPGWPFFKEFYKISKTGKLGIILLVKTNNKIIGGIIAPFTQDKNIYEWYVVGLDNKYKKQYPSILATWAPIDYALKNNLLQFDFMGLGKPDVDYGVRDFKLNFGGTEQVVNYGRFGRRNKILYPLVEWMYNLMRYIKLV